MIKSKLKSVVPLIYILILWATMIAVCIDIYSNSDTFSSKLNSLLLLLPTFLSVAIYTLNKIPIFNVIFFKIVNLNKLFSLSFTSIITSSKEIDLTDFTSDSIEEKFKLLNYQVKIQYDDISQKVFYTITPENDLTLSIELNKINDRIYINFTQIHANRRVLLMSIKKFQQITDIFKSRMAFSDERLQLKIRFHKKSNPYLKFFIKDSNLMTNISIDKSTYLNNDLIEIITNNNPDMVSKVEKYILGLKY